MTVALGVAVAGFVVMAIADAFVDEDRHPALRSVLILGGAVVLLGGVAALLVLASDALKIPPTLPRP